MMNAKGNSYTARNVKSSESDMNLGQSSDVDGITGHHGKKYLHGALGRYADGYVQVRYLPTCHEMSLQEVIDHEDLEYSSDCT